MTTPAFDKGSILDRFKGGAGRKRLIEVLQTNAGILVGDAGIATKVANAATLMEVPQDKPKGARGDQVNRDSLPRTVWKFAADTTRARGEMEDKATHYNQESNVLYINGDFRTFVAWIDYFAKQYPSIAGVRETIKAQVEIWWEQMLLEAVLAFQDFRRSPHWTEMHTLTDEALTMAVLPRYHLFNVFKRGIRTQLGKPEVEASDPLAVPAPVAAPAAGAGS